MSKSEPSVSANNSINPLNYRIHYLDHVRAFAMLLGIFLHAALPYAAGAQNIWYLTDKSSSVGLTILFDFIHLFRMALFFLISGFFANLLIKKRGVKGFLKNRANRILVPFLVFFPLIFASYAGYFIFAFNYLTVEEMSPLLIYISEISADPNAEQPSMGTTHLWFLYNLVYFCLIAAALQNIKSEKITQLANTFFESSSHLLYIPLFLVPTMYVVQAPFPTPNSFMPQWWSYSYYGLFFFAGWHFFYHKNYLDEIKLHLRKLISFSIVAFVAYIVLIPSTDFSNGLPPEILEPYVGFAFDPRKFVIVLLQAYLSVYLTLIFLYFGKVLLSRENKYMRYITDASYWIYIIHVPLLLVIQISITRTNWPVLIKFTTSIVIAFAIALFIYDSVVRYSFIGTMLNGKKTRQANGLRSVPNPSQTQ